jgi:Protein of unknown function (DUF2569)
MGAIMTETVSAAPQQAIPVGIKGWLILPAIGTVVSPVYLVIAIFGMQPTLEKVWAARSALSTGLLTFVAVEFVLNIAFVLGWIAAIFLLISKSPYYPKAYIVLMVGMVIFLAADMIISAGAYNHQPDQSDLLSLARTAVVAAIWCPYMLLSKRAKNTFVTKA